MRASTIYLVGFQNNSCVPRSKRNKATVVPSVQIEGLAKMISQQEVQEVQEYSTTAVKSSRQMLSSTKAYVYQVDRLIAAIVASSLASFHRLRQRASTSFCGGDKKQILLLANSVLLALYYQYYSIERDTSQSRYGFWQ